MPRTKSKPESDWMTVDDLPPAVRVRLEHAGQWVAWDHGMTRAVAFGADPEAVRAEAIAAGTVRPIMEWVPPTETRPSSTD